MYRGPAVSMVEKGGKGNRKDRFILCFCILLPFLFLCQSNRRATYGLLTQHVELLIILKVNENFKADLINQHVTENNI